MKNAILIHGWTSERDYYDPSRPTPSNDHWFPWLTKQLVLRDINTVAVEMPDSYYPRYDIWKRELERYDITEETILVGWSCGGGFLVRWLSESDLQVGKVVLAAPWLGYGIDGENTDFATDFFNFEIDNSFADKTESTHLLYSTDDMRAILESVDKLEGSTNGLQVREFSNKGHFTLSSLGGEAFPELLDILTA